MGLNINDQTRVMIAGNSTISYISSLYKELNTLVVENSSIEIFVDEGAEFDLTLIQLIESARQTAADIHCHLALAMPASGALRAMLERGGFVPEGDAERRGFWFHEESK